MGPLLVTGDLGPTLKNLFTYGSIEVELKNLGDTNDNNTHVMLCMFFYTSILSQSKLRSYSSNMICLIFWDQVLSFFAEGLTKYHQLK